MTMTFQQALDYVKHFDDPYQRALRDQGNQTWGIAGMQDLLSKLGDPHLSYPVIHVAGTKGKGSTCAFIAQGLIESGLKVGLYSSPHVMDWRERIQIDRKWIDREKMATLVSEFAPIVEGMPLSEFEASTALAFWHFAREKVDGAVIEVGLGGRLDATNVVQPAVAVVTNISLDHTQLLGDTLEVIAGEKAAIIKPGALVVVAPQHRKAMRVILKRVQTQDTPVVVVGEHWKFEPLEMDWSGSEMQVGDRRRSLIVEVGMPGAFQLENAAVALAALNQAEKAGIAVTRAGRINGLRKARWPARLEVVSEEPRIVLDGAHNPYSVMRLTDTVNHLLDPSGHPERRPTYIFGCMADKDIDSMLRALEPAAFRIVFVAADNPRAADPADLLERATKLRGDFSLPELSVADSLQAAIDAQRASLGPDDTLLITGSLSVAGEARRLLVGDGEA